MENGGEERKGKKKEDKKGRIVNSKGKEHERQGEGEEEEIKEK